MSSGEPTRPSRVSAARRSSWPGLDRDRARGDPAHAHLGRERAREHARQHRLRRLRRAVRPRTSGQGSVRGDVLDDRPARRATRAARARQPARGRTSPWRSTSSAASQSASVTSSIGFGTKPSPAAWTTRSSPPSSLERRADERARAVARRAGRRRRARRRARVQPSARRRAAIARPTRPVPPATSARLSVLCKDMLAVSKTERSGASILLSLGTTPTQSNNQREAGSPMRKLILALSSGRGPCIRGAGGRGDHEDDQHLRLRVLAEARRRSPRATPSRG